DAVGEAFDKVAKMTGLPYPGGPSVAQAAANGDPNKYQLPKSKTDGEYDFSFSGLKTAVLRLAQEQTGHDYTFHSSKLPAALSKAQKTDIAASFQSVAIETLVDKLKLAVEQYQPKSIVIAGGVAANHLLRSEVAKIVPADQLFIPDIKLCTDNAAMIAALGYFRIKSGARAARIDKLSVEPGLQM
ncbi:tRNA (adenosine(37)-N6)-threonylcarbamoyltransferase complex transferase subunit TsaD, partial [Candidatus Saccharibacteria bacterium]|nr:tRNA (adenosine(37)-N6)-threonylcarbamoyltransferase complex transferase subunit TsaD [Candidatus Saccharibacteria bacterium]